MKKPRVALAHEFLTEHGGAEKTFEAIVELFPGAPIFTAKYNPKKMPDVITKRKVISPKNGLAAKAAKFFFAFMMAPIFEEMDFSEYDLVLSDGNTWNKGILVKPDQLHITYVHTPPRFLYKYSSENTKRNKWYFKWFFAYMDNILRMWDFVAAQRPDFMLANSQETKNRVQKFYRRDALVINPPVDVEFDEDYEADSFAKPYYIAVGRLVKYKNFDLLIEAFNLSGLPLVIVGTGNYEKKLRSIAASNITFKGRVSDAEKNRLIHHSLGLINPVKDEDFGIVPIEAAAHGIPVLAHKSGGHTETVIDGVTGMLFEGLDVKSLVDKIKEFDHNSRSGVYKREKMIEHSKTFSKIRFQKEYYKFVMDKWEEFSQQSADSE